MGSLLAALLPDEPEVAGLLALLLLADARRVTRTDAEKRLVLLADQDRSRWDRGKISEGLGLLGRALAADPPGRYTIHAAIAAEHATAEHARDTDWPAIVRWYELLRRRDPAPVVELNHARPRWRWPTAPIAGLRLLDGLLDEPTLARSHRLHGTRAELLRRAGRITDALALAGTDAEQDFYRRQREATTA
jgi:RNA polymerase sigma-70 factor, ECF subfamily